MAQRLTEHQKALAKANGQLRYYKPFINGEIEEELGSELGRSKSTIEEYMLGRGRDIHFAIKLLERVRTKKEELIGRIDAEAVS